MRITSTTILGLSAMAVMASAALAADLPSRRAPPAYSPPPALPVFTWTGIFGGLNAGAAFDQARGPFANGAGVPFVGGGQIGFNYQFGSSTAGLGPLSTFGTVLNGVGGGLAGAGGGLFGAGSGIVFGGIADAQYLNGQNGTTFAPGVAANGLAYSSTNYLGTVRGRLGVSISRALIYGTGGYAYNLRRSGYAVGGGIEFAVSNNVTVGAEYLYVDMRRGGSAFADNTGVPTNQRGDFSVARGFVNLKFDPFQSLTAPPVVARY